MTAPMASPELAAQVRLGDELVALELRHLGSRMIVLREAQVGTPEIATKGGSK